MDAKPERAKPGEANDGKAEVRQRDEASSFVRPERKLSMNAPLKAVIQAHPFLEGMKPEHIDLIADSATELTFEADQILFQEGEPANRLYLIEAGRIAVEAHELANGTALVETLGLGDVLGWSWLFPPFTWHFRARALEPTRVIALNGAHLLIAAERDHDFGYRLMKRVAQVLIHRVQAERRQLFARPMQSALAV
jgi:CRP-like cAMP-binding protein